MHTSMFFRAGKDKAVQNFISVGLQKVIGKCL